MTTKLWITRTEPSAKRSALAWSEVGYEPIIAPLLTVRPIEHGTDIPNQSELIFTSAHGVRNCGLQADSRRVYTVGDATAAVARDYGFKSVTSADGDWKKLLQVIEKTQNTLVHISGSEVRGTLVETLQSRGFNALRQVVYETRPVANWPVDLNEIDAIALYSPLATKTLMALPQCDLSGLTAFCLSPNVAAPLKALKGVKVFTADRPTEAALIACSRAAQV